MDEQKVLQAVEDQEFLKKVVNLETPEEVQAAFKQDKGIDISLDEINNIQKMVGEKVDGGELSEDDLENVAGGSVSVAVIGAVVAGVVALGNAVNNWTNRRW